MAYKIEVETVFTQRGAAGVVSEFEGLLKRLSATQYPGSSGGATALADFKDIQGQLGSGINKLASEGLISSSERQALNSAITKMSRQFLEAGDGFAESARIARRISQAATAAGPGSLDLSARGRSVQGSAYDARQALLANAPARAQEEAALAEKAAADKVAAEAAKAEAKAAEKAAAAAEKEASRVERRAALDVEKAEAKEKQRIHDAAAREAKAAEKAAEEAEARAAAYARGQSYLPGGGGPKGPSGPPTGTPNPNDPFHEQGVINAGAKTEAAQLEAATKELLSVMPEYSSSLARSKTAQTKIEADVTQQLSESNAFVGATARLSRVRDVLATKELEAASTEENLKAAVNRQIAEANSSVKLKSGVVDAKLADPEGQAKAGELAANTAKLAAIIDQIAQAELAGAEDYIKATAGAKIARERQALEIRAQVAGVAAESTGSMTKVELQVETALRERAESNVAAAAIARATLANEKGALDALVGKKVAEEQLAAALKKRVTAETEGVVATEEVTRFQLLQARLAAKSASGASKDPSSFQTLGEFAGQKAVTTAAFALSGGLLFGAISQVKDLVSQAENLQVTFAKIDAQFVSLGRAADFAPTKSAILDIARSTGVAGDEVAHVAFQFIGAFGDTNVALKNTAAAMELTQVTGLSLGETIDSLTAISKSFDISMTSIGDTSVGLEERFGVLAKETIGFTSLLAPVADEIGLSFKDAASLGAATQQASGRASSSLAEGFGRILPQIGKIQDQILTLYQSPALKGSFDKILAGYQSGNTGDVFKQIVFDVDRLKHAGQGADQQFVSMISTLLGGRREAQVLIAALKNSGALAQEFRANAADALQGTDRDAGKLNQRFVAFQDTIKNTGERLKQAFSQVGQALFDAGLADLMSEAASAGEVLLGTIRKLGDAMKFLNGFKIPFTDNGAVGELAKFAAVAVLTTKAYGLLFGAKTADTVASKLVSEATLEEQSASIAAAIAKQGEATATDELVVSNDAATVSEVSLAESEAAEAAASGAGRFAKIGQSLFAGGHTGRIPGIPSFGFGAAGEEGAATGASGAGIAGLVTAGALAVKLTYDSTKGGLDTQRKALEDQLTKATDKQLDDIANSQTDFWTSFSDFILQQPLAEEMAAKIQTQRKIDAAKPSVQTLINSGNLHSFSQGISDTNLATLNAYFNQNSDLKSFGVKVGGTQTADTANGDTLQGDQNLGVISGVEITKDNLDTVIPNLVKSNDPRAAEAMRYINEVLNTQHSMISLKKVVADLVAGGETEAAISAAGGVSAFTESNVKDSKAQFDAGIIGKGNYLDTVRAQIAIQESKKAAGGDAWTNVGGADEIQLANMKKILTDSASADAKAMLDTIAKTAQYTGQGRSPIIASLTQAVAGIGQYANLNPADQAASVDELMKTLHDQFESDVAAIKNPVERLAKLKAGFTIPKELQTGYIKTQLAGNENFSKVGRDLANAIGVNFDAINAWVSEQVATTDKTIAQATLDAIDIEIFKVKSQLAVDKGNHDNHAFAIHSKTLADLQSQRITAAGTDFGAAPSELGGTGGPTPEELQAAQNAADDANAAAAVARINQQIQAAHGDPIRIAQLQQQIARLNAVTAQRHGDMAAEIQAQTDLNTAFQAEADAQADIVTERLKLTAARDSRDPVKAAQDALSLANNQLSRARSEKERIDATISQVTAQQSLDKALQDVLASRASLAEAILNASGDTVGAAQVALDEAKRKLAEAEQNGAGEAEINNLKAAVATQTASARSASDQKKLGEIDFLLQMEQITQSQAIQMLQALLAIPGETEDFYKSVQLKIKQLQGELKSDFQFNLPTNIGLPTLYESRRLSQSPGGYQDNRNVNIQITVTDGLTATQAVDAIKDAVGGAPRVVTNRRY